MLGGGRAAGGRLASGRAVGGVRGVVGRQRGRAVGGVRGRLGGWRQSGKRLGGTLSFPATVQVQYCINVGGDPYPPDQDNATRSDSPLQPTQTHF